MRREQPSEHAGVREHLNPQNGERGGQERFSQSTYSVGTRIFPVAPWRIQIPVPRFVNRSPPIRQRDTIDT